MFPPLHTQWLPRLRRLGARLIKPAPSITDPQEQRTARLLAALLALTLIILLFGRAVRLFIDYQEPPVQITAIWLNIFVLFVAYCLSRTRFHRIGAILTMTAISAVLYLQMLYRGYSNPGDVSNPAAWLVALLLLSSFIISWRATLILSAANLAGLWMLPRIVPGITYLDTRFSFELIFALSLVIALVTYLRRRDWTLIQTQTEVLIESENRYRTLFSASFEAIVVHDDGVVIEVNDTFQNLFGYSKEEMIGAQVLAFIPPEWQTTIFEKARENILLYEIQGLHKNGGVFDMEVNVKRIMYKGRLLRVVAMRDITERKRAENERIQLITETERSRVLRQFISDASHDLRQPLATMNTSLYLLRRKSTDLGEAATHVDTLDAQLAHLTRLLEDLFAMSRLDEPELYMERAPLDLDQLVLRVIQELVPVAASKKQSLNFDANGRLPAVLADQVDMRRAISHLITNALVYSHEGGKVTIRTLLEKQKVVVEVQDTGIGIGPQDLPHIFERFYRADLARQTETGGSGLGLAIVQKIIENHSGTIDVESCLGVGSTFRIYLPLPSQSLAG